MDEILFENVSGLGEKEFKVALKPFVIKMAILCVVTFAVMLGLGLLWILLWKDYVFGAVMIVFGIAFVVSFPIIMKTKVNSEFKNKLSGTVLNTFEFTDNMIMVKSERKTEGQENFMLMGTQNLAYQEIHHVEIAQDYLYIFLNPQQRFVLNPKGMLIGDYEEFKTFLKSKIKLVNEKPTK